MTSTMISDLGAKTIIDIVIVVVLSVVSFSLVRVLLVIITLSLAMIFTVIRINDTIITTSAILIYKSSCYCRC